MVLTEEQEQLIRLKLDVKTFEKQVAKLHRSLSQYDLISAESSKKDYIESAHFFYTQLIAPAQEILTNKESLIIIPDGLLGQLPFETFLKSPAQLDDPYSKMDYLLHHYQISYSYSAQLLSENMNSSRPSNNSNIFAIAASYEGSAPTARERSARAQMPRKALQPLPAAAIEVEQLAKQLGAETIVGAQANEAVFKSKASDYQIIHLAMHGLLNERNPMLSSLAFTENGDQGEDNFLEVHEISAMQLSAELVVLSACETGYGKFQQGEGVMSLARSFMYAGVPSLVVSMWQVNDASTAIIMNQFYQNLQQGDNKALALQRAKQVYLEQAAKDNPLAAHPAFWAAFIQLGDERALDVQATSATGSFWWWALAIGGMLLLGLVFFFLQKKKRG